MKRINIIVLIIFSTTFLLAQEKFLTKNGIVEFEASVPSFEEVAAINTKVTAILDTKNGQVAALALVKAFRFKNALMEEHFNENYAESSKYPKATLKGNLENFDFDNLKASYIFNGELTFHGVSKKLENIKVFISENSGVINCKGSFNTKASDFNIEIPSVVRKKISEDVNVSFSFDLKMK